MKFFVTGVGGQLGHDVMNELLKRGHEGVGSDIQVNYSGVSDGSAVTKAPYVSLDITNKDAVEKVITEVNPDAVIHCAAWTAVDMAEDDDKESPCHQCRRHTEYRGCLQEAGLQDDLYQHGLCVRWSGDGTMGARLQGL